MAEEINERKMTYVSLPALELSAERELPGNVYLCLRHKIVRYRHKGDKLDAKSFNNLIYNHVKYVFIEEAEREAFKAWISGDQDHKRVEQMKEEVSEAAPVIEAVVEQRRVMMDIFQSPKENPQIKAAIDVSKKLVTEFLRKPFAINNIQALQRYSKGCVDHSVNVSVLSVFLGLRMGYSHQLILENLAMGGLLHDFGKTLVEPKDEGLAVEENEEDDPEMQQHPQLGADTLFEKNEIANEVRMIIAQHHEFLDGSGYPNRLRGLAIYDLARLVAIANVYDNLVSESMGETMKAKAEEAVDRLEKEYEGRLDPKKLEKVVKILRYSFL